MNPIKRSKLTQKIMRIEYKQFIYSSLQVDQKISKYTPLPYHLEVAQKNQKTNRRICDNVHMGVRDERKEWEKERGPKSRERDEWKGERWRVGKTANRSVLTRKVRHHSPLPPPLVPSTPRISVDLAVPGRLFKGESLSKACRLVS